MRKQAWGGEPPGTEEEGRERILEAARRVIQREGLDGANVASIAREAGIARPTLYRYFEDAAEILRNAEVRAGGGLVREMLEACAAVPRLADRLVESLRILAERIPEDALLSQYFEGEDLEVLTSPVAMSYSAQFLESMWAEDDPRVSAADVRALAEIMLLLLFSLVRLKGGTPGTRRFLEAHVRPMLAGWLQSHAR